MNQPSISVQNLSKLYKIGIHRDRYNTIRGALSSATTGLVKRILSRPSQEDPETDLWALQDVSFDVNPGEIIGVIGRNGAGKSTLLKILSQITAPTKGVIEIRGRVASLLEVGTGFHPELSGRENIFLNGAILGMRRAEILRKLDEIIEFAEVSRFIDTPVKRYSSGMYVRLAFAVAAHLEPDILMVDEVLAVGDVYFQKKCIGRMTDVAASQGRTVLFVSHNLPAIERLCQRCILLRGGKLVAQGTPRDVIREYLDSDIDDQREWHRLSPPPVSAYLRRISLINHSGHPITTVTTDMSIGIEIECVSPMENPDIQLGLCILDSLGGVLFSTNPLDANEPYPTKVGNHRYRVFFAPSTFLPQRYSVTVSLYAHKTNIDHCPSVVVFDVTPVASISNNVDGGRPGVLFLACAWQHEWYTKEQTIT
jgi:lipopolysaccharide transport system ATP-binding protein